MDAGLKYTIVRFFYQPGFKNKIRLKDLEIGCRPDSYRDRDWQMSECVEVSQETSS